jgi:hypothetical protein
MSLHRRNSVAAGTVVSTACAAGQGSRRDCNTEASAGVTSDRSSRSFFRDARCRMMEGSARHSIATKATPHSRTACSICSRDDESGNVASRITEYPAFSTDWARAAKVRYVAAVMGGEYRPRSSGSRRSVASKDLPATSRRTSSLRRCTLSTASDRARASVDLPVLGAPPMAIASGRAASR